MNKLDLNEIAKFINGHSEDTRVYMGVDSERFKIDGLWYADYILVVVVHINGKNGCKIFGDVVRERDYDQKPNRPSYRLMNEVYKVSELYLNLYPLIPGRKVEVHLDINPQEEYGSSCVIQQAVGYIKGTCGLDPLVKPDAFAASYAADRYKSFMYN
jgi:hypothetical protein